MHNFSKIGSKYQPAKWLLGMCMLFSIFTFTGFSVAIGQGFREAVKTEISLSREASVAKRTISYQRGYGLCRKQVTAPDFGQNLLKLNRSYTLLLKVKFDWLSVQEYPTNPYFYHFRTAIPENLDPEISPIG
jgi:hypothetical protein